MFGEKIKKLVHQEEFKGKKKNVYIYLKIKNSHAPDKVLFIRLRV